MEYVRKYDCCAVLCKDTDFVVSDIKALVISAPTLNVNEMTASVYDKVELTQKLRIEVNELPLFATLVGNDIVPIFDLQVLTH